MAQYKNNPDKEVQEMENMEIKISKEMKEELIKLAKSEDKAILKFLCDQYYQSQAFRIRAQNQARALFQGADETADEGHPEYIETQLKNASYQESFNKKCIDVVTDNIPVCRWMRSIKGIGPMMSMYLFSRFEVEGRYGSDFISYCGLNDHHVPWLGTDKAHKLMKEIKAEYFSQLREVEDVLADIVGADKIEFIKKKISSEAKKNKTKDLSFDELELLINREMSKVSKSWKYCSLDEHDPDMTIASRVDAYSKSLVHEDYATDLLYSICSVKTGRKSSLIKHGTINSWENAKNKRKKYVTISDVESFLAKPPYNLELKTKVWLISDLFMKNKNRGSMYGKLIDQRLAYETEKNERREYADQAAKILSEKNIQDKKTLECLRDGKLTQAHLIRRSMRFAVKLFISHVYEAMYYAKYHKEAPKTYVIAYLEHHDYVAPEIDYHPFIDGLK